MLTIVCGEDTKTARNQYLLLKEEYKKKGYLLQTVDTTELANVYNSSSGVVDLFGKECIYLINNLSSVYKGRGETEIKKTIQNISLEKNIYLLDWEEGKSAYELSSIKKVASSFSEFKPGRSIFQLLDYTYPKNLDQFIETLNAVYQSQDIMFIYTLLWRHVRKLLLAQKNIFDAKTQTWQKPKLSSQANKWSGKSLLNFYEGLIRIDWGMKTGTSTFDVKESIEILACHYLK